MTLAIKRTLLDRQGAPGKGTLWAPDFASVISASLQAEWTGQGRVVIVLRGLLDGNTPDILAELDTDRGYGNGEIVHLDGLPVGLEQIQAELVLAEGASAVSLYIRARE
jgi:hypothetical protein